MTLGSLIRVGDTVINLDNVITINLNWENDGDSKIVFEFLLRGSDELEGGESIVQPYLLFFEGKEAEAIRNHLKKTVPDLLASD